MNKEKQTSNMPEVSSHEEHFYETNIILKQLYFKFVILTITKPILLRHRHKHYIMI